MATNLTRQLNAARAAMFAKGPCVLLRNQSVVYGEAVQLGDSISVRRDNGSRIVLPREDVLCWGPSALSLYEYKADRRRGVRPDRLIQDARWSLRYGLLAESAEDVKLARHVVGDTREIVQLMNQIADAVAAYGDSSVDSEGDSESAVQQASYETENADVAEEIVSEADPETLRTFVRHIQPILLNQCVQCHDLDCENAFRLNSPANGSRPSQAISVDNLSTVLGYMDLDAPESSELIARSSDDHAGADARTSSIQDRWIATLTQWGTIAKPNTETVKTFYSKAKRDRDAASQIISVHELDASESPQDETELSEADSSKRLARLPPVQNPFDPELFNRRYHSPE
ncbi:hypothetical protein [Stieleria varia]|uniref:Cytochrome c domain-containing protein n=1 Tax=Stieleria varia TaxID=2528005 RepID=A0A5C6BBC6_9BACT|nr:hypothetical protein [Stieleria varia]TWU08556.1 hypothetical protein Pla52n_11390 [Stieleria varia]